MLLRKKISYTCKFTYIGLTQMKHFHAFSLIKNFLCISPKNSRMILFENSKITRYKFMKHLTFSPYKKHQKQLHILRKSFGTLVLMIIFLQLIPDI
jgi:hypothetical protein